MKNYVKSFFNQPQADSQSQKLNAEVERARAKFSQIPRFVPGQLSIFGWDLEYVDGLALVSCIESQVLKGQNDFVSSKQAPFILDCGANVGVSVLHYKRLFSDAKIIAFEPDPQIFPVLKRNLERNGASDVQVVQAAVWIEKGEARFFCEGADGSRLASVSVIDGPSVVVKTVDFSSYIDQEVDLIKMDIEGAEYAVIPSLVRKLGLVKNLSIECHIANEHVDGFGQVLSVLDRSGYVVSINTYGVWRDLVKSPPKLPAEFDQYAIVSAWRASQLYTN